ncbi:MAG: diaminopimelate epimerase [Gammaproteobacteria bacterium]|nr:MAG: diaminopimelate epimerase [Gammaproteobacteria bacterium]RKZ72335.1 MAG: diaminopimelate epimerase [Gammaproteobacteria bacterium]
MEIQFTKMHGLGNDFVVMDSFAQEIQLSAEQVRLIADRHFGIGCDQLLLLAPSDKEGVDVRYLIYNADGGEVSQCGNGARCAAAYLRENGLIEDLVDGKAIAAETNEGIITMHLEKDGRVRVNMGIPKLAATDIPLDTQEDARQYRLNLSDTEITFSAVSMGNPHAVIVVDDVSSAPVLTMGPEVQQQTFFPEGVNVGFMQIIDSGHIKLRVYERGAGETLACGSGACAAVVAGCINSSLDQEVDVELPGGHLLISWAGQGEPVWMTGPATFVYRGQISL